MNVFVKSCIVVCAGIAIVNLVAPSAHAGDRGAAAESARVHTGGVIDFEDLAIGGVAQPLVIGLVSIEGYDLAASAFYVGPDPSQFNSVGGLDGSRALEYTMSASYAPGYVIRLGRPTGSFSLDVNPYSVASMTEVRVQAYAPGTDDVVIDQLYPVPGVVLVQSAQPFDRLWVGNQSDYFAVDNLDDFSIFLDGFESGNTENWIPVVESTDLTVYLPGDVPLTLVRIPAGTFWMGSPEDEPGGFSRETLHQVTLTQDYYLGKYDVTQRQWRAVMGANPSYFRSCGMDCPVETVSWNDICGGTTGAECTSTSFIGRLNAHLGTSAFRLPTEAEWERAARGGTQTAFSFAAPATWDLECGSFPEAMPYMWWCNNSGSTTHLVGSKMPNPYGLSDMHGNVWEWVADWYGSYPSTAVTDPTGPTTGPFRVIRGGGWGYGARYCRSAYRMYDVPYDRNYETGFRLARTP